MNKQLAHQPAAGPVIATCMESIAGQEYVSDVTPCRSYVQGSDL